MKLREKIVRLMARSLCHSLEINEMVSMVNRFIPNYNYRRRMGVSESVSIAKPDAARQIVKDVWELGCFPDFVGTLIRAEAGDFSGRKHEFLYLDTFVAELNDFGLIFDKASAMFMENPNVRRTRNWSVLREGNEYFVSMLRLDLVGNSKLVRKYGKEDIEYAYKHLRDTTREVVEFRNGRIWRWDGDGGLSAFHFKNRIQDAVLSGVEILHRLFLFNHFSNRLPEDLRIRIAVESGHIEYTENDEILLHSELVKRAILLESQYTAPDSLTIGVDSQVSLSSALSNKFWPVDADTTRKLLFYSLRWGEK